MMRRLFLGRKGQSITEYAILVSVIVGALIAMQVYVKNTLSAKIKLAADGIHGGQEILYQPKTTQSARVTVSRDGMRSSKADASDYKIDVTGAGSDVIEDWTETKFQELAIE